MKNNVRRVMLDYPPNEFGIAEIAGQDTRALTQLAGMTGETENIPVGFALEVRHQMTTDKTERTGYQRNATIRSHSALGNTSGAQTDRIAQHLSLGRLLPRQIEIGSTEVAEGGGLPVDRARKSRSRMIAPGRRSKFSLISARIRSSAILPVPNVST